MTVKGTGTGSAIFVDSATTRGEMLAKRMPSRGLPVYICDARTKKT